jgi:hypothetical protein
MITQKLLDVAKGVAREELDNEKWLRLMARLIKRSFEQTRVTILELLDTDIYNVSVENCVAFLDPLIESWDMDLETFGVDIILNRRLTARHLNTFGFAERESETPIEAPAALEEFVKDITLSGDGIEEELTFLKTLRFRASRPTALYYYRELLNLRDPLHFRATVRREGGTWWRCYDTNCLFADPGTRGCAHGRAPPLFPQGNI